MGTEFAISGSSLAVLVGALVLAGALVGIMSGLLGIGGGGIWIGL